MVSTRAGDAAGQHVDRSADLHVQRDASLTIGHSAEQKLMIEQAEAYLVAHDTPLLPPTNPRI